MSGGRCEAVVQERFGGFCWAGLGVNKVTVKVSWTLCFLSRFLRNFKDVRINHCVSQALAAGSAKRRGFPKVKSSAMRSRRALYLQECKYKTTALLRLSANTLL